MRFRSAIAALATLLFSVSSAACQLIVDFEPVSGVGGAGGSGGDGGAGGFAGGDAGVAGFGGSQAQLADEGLAAGLAKGD